MKSKTKTDYGVPHETEQRYELRKSIRQYVEQNNLQPPLSMEELREHAQPFSAGGATVEYAMVIINNEIWRETVASIPYDRRLLLLPQCLRHLKDCPATMDEFGLLCEACGRCNIGLLQSLAEELGYVVLIAEGSTVVSKLLAGGKVDAVIGVSCLHALEKSFPHLSDGAIPGLAIPLTVDGCIGTETDVEQVCEAIRLKSEMPWEGQMDLEAVRSAVETWFSKTADWPNETETERIAYDWMLKDGKRWRPYLLACTWRALADDIDTFPEDVRRLSVAVECFHKASLVHDDIEDNDDRRYGRPTLHRQYNMPIALNAGDLLVGEGYRWITSVEHHAAELLRIAAENHRMLCIGQGEEFSGLGRETPLTVKQCIEIFRCKTAPAFGVSLQLGATAAGGDAALAATLGTFSEALGIAYQIRDDLEEYRNGEARDLSASILLALANDHGPAEWYRTDTPNLDHVFEELMVTEKADQLLQHYKNTAIRTLNPLRSARLKGLLRRVTSSMLSGS